MPPRASATPARYRLVISPSCHRDGATRRWIRGIRGLAAGAEGEIVGAALRSGAGVKGFEDDVDNALRGEDVATADGGGTRGGEEGSLRDADCVTNATAST